MGYLLISIILTLIVSSSQLPINNSTEQYVNGNFTTGTISLTNDVSNKVKLTSTHTSGDSRTTIPNSSGYSSLLITKNYETTTTGRTTITTAQPKTKSTNIALTTTTEKNSDVWDWLDTAPDKNIDGYEEDYTGSVVWKTTYLEQTTGIIPVVSIWPIAQAFFYLNWLWCLLVVLAVVILFCIPGMYIQICCNKYYRAYKREKLDKKRIIRGTKDEDTVKIDIIPVQSNVQTEPLYDECCTDDLKDEIPGDSGDKKSVDSINQSNCSNNNPLPEESPPTPPILPPAQETYYAETPVPLPDIPTDIANSNENVGNAGSVTSYDSPYPLSDTRSSVKCPSEEVQPNHTVIYSVPQKSITLSSEPEPVRRSPVNVAKDYESEAIINTNEPYINQPLVRPPKPDAYKVPKRPPKPKQYRIKPMTPSQLKEKRLNREKRREHKKKENSPHTKRRKPKKIIVNKPRDNDSKHPSKPDVAEARDPSTSQKKAANIHELRRKEQLLRQLIKGFQEAEMLQRKLDRTRKWATEQKKNEKASGDVNNEQMRTSKRPGKPETKRPGKVGSAKSKYPPNKRSGDKPPRYEDVMSESSSARPKTTRHQKMTNSKRK